MKGSSKILWSPLWILSPRPETYVGKTYRLKVKTCMACWKQLTIKHNSLSSSTQHSALQQRALKSDNLEYYTLVRWDKRFVDQASDVPSISFLCQNPFNSFFFLFFFKCKNENKEKRSAWHLLFWVQSFTKFDIKVKLTWIWHKSIRNYEKGNSWNVKCLVDN